jgi:hypothetical protein
MLRTRSTCVRLLAATACVACAMADALGAPLSPRSHADPLLVRAAHCSWNTAQHKKCARDSDRCVVEVTRMPGYVEGRLTDEQRAAFEKCRADYATCNNKC